MRQLSSSAAPSRTDAHLVDVEGRRVGRVTEVYLDPDTQRLEWALVHTAELGGRASFVPLAGAAVVGAEVLVPYSKHLVEAAPAGGGDSELTPADEAALHRHYGLAAPEQAADRWSADLPPAARPVTAQPTDEVIILPAPRLLLRTTRAPSELVRLRHREATDALRSLATSSPAPDRRPDRGRPAT